MKYKLLAHTLGINKYRSKMEMILHCVLCMNIFLFFFSHIYKNKTWLSLFSELILNFVRFVYTCIFVFFSFNTIEEPWGQCGLKTKFSSCMIFAVSTHYYFVVHWNVIEVIRFPDILPYFLVVPVGKFSFCYF